MTGYRWGATIAKHPPIHPLGDTCPDDNLPLLRVVWPVTGPDEMLDRQTVEDLYAEAEHEFAAIAKAFPVEVTATPVFELVRTPDDRMASTHPASFTSRWMVAATAPTRRIRAEDAAA